MSKKKIRKKVRPIITKRSLEQLYEGCALMRRCREILDDGRTLEDRVALGDGRPDPWVAFASNLARLGEVGLAEADRLDTGHDYTHPQNLSKPASCRTLAQALGEENLGCGTLCNPCGFIDHAGAEASPYRHALGTPVPLTSHERPIGQLKAEVKAVVEKFLDKGGAFLIGGSPGLGKSAAAIKAIAARKGPSLPRIAYFAPRHDLLEEVFEKLTKRRVDVALRPKIEQKTCPARQHELIQFYQAQKKNYRKLVCEARDCPYLKKGTCPYWRGVEAVKSARVALYPTVMLEYEDFEEEIKGRKLILDEDPTRHLLPTIWKTPKALRELVGLYRRAAKLADPEARAFLRECQEVLVRILAMCHSGTKVTLVRGRDLGLSRVPTRVPGLKVRQALEEARRGSSFANVPSRRNVPNELTFLQRLVECARRRSRDVIGIVDHIGPGLPSRWVVVLGYRRRLPKKADVLILDATGEREHYEALLGRKLEVVGGHARHTSKLIQYVDASYAKMSYEKAGAISRAKATIKAILKRETPNAPALVCHMDQRENFEPIVGKKRTNHFNAVSGTNKPEFREADVGIVIGTPCPPVWTIRALAGLLYRATEAELAEVPSSSRRRFYRGASIHPWEFEGEVLRRAHAHYVESGIIQAMGRFRYLDGEKMIFILSNAVIDLPKIEARWASHDFKIFREHLDRTRRARYMALVAAMLAAAHKLLAEGIELDNRLVAEEAGYNPDSTKKYWPKIREMLGDLVRVGRRWTRI